VPFIVTEKKRLVARSFPIERRAKHPRADETVADNKYSVKRLLRSPANKSRNPPQLLRESQITSKDGSHGKAGLTESKSFPPIVLRPA
jgi:hypothetical protein